MVCLFGMFHGLGELFVGHVRGVNVLIAHFLPPVPAGSRPEGEPEALIGKGGGAQCPTFAI